MRKTTRFLTIALALALLLTAVTPTLRISGASDPEPRKATAVSSLYARIENRLARQPQIAQSLGKPPAELVQARWLVGRWNVNSRVFAQSDHYVAGGESVVEPIMGGTWLQIQDIYDAEVQDLGFLTINPVTSEWVAIGIDRTGNAVITKAQRWEDDRLVLLSENAEVLGERIALRQILTKVSDREYHVLNEERLENGIWAQIDEYVYTKR